jgi:hypothetical protein
MPKYYFHISEGGSTVDTVAADLQGPMEARRHARVVGGALDPIGQETIAAWKVTVSDSNGRKLFETVPRQPETIAAAGDRL